MRKLISIRNWGGAGLVAVCDVCYNTIVLRTGILLSERTKAIDGHTTLHDPTHGGGIRKAGRTVTAYRIEAGASRQAVDRRSERIRQTGAIPASDGGRR